MPIPPKASAARCVNNRGITRRYSVFTCPARRKRKIHLHRITRSFVYLTADELHATFEIKDPSTAALKVKLHYGKTGELPNLKDASKTITMVLLKPTTCSVKGESKSPTGQHTSTHQRLPCLCSYLMPCHKPELSPSVHRSRTMRLCQ